MEKIRKYLHKQKKGTKPLDPCPVCGDELYYDEEYSQKVALLDSMHSVEGWMCPWCKSRFDFEDNLTYISMPGTTRGKA